MININGEIWGLAFVSPFDSILQRLDGTYTIGVCDNDTKTIYISNVLEGQLLKKVLCHELTHCAMFSYHIYLDE